MCLMLIRLAASRFRRIAIRGGISRIADGPAADGALVGPEKLSLPGLGDAELLGLRTP